MSEHDLTFPSMGSEVRLIVTGPAARESAEEARRWIEGYARRLSRFVADSELCELNAARGEIVPASPLLCLAVRAALWTAKRSGGLVDPTLLGEIERAGYAQSRIGETPIPLADALADAPVRRPARPDPAERWRRFSVEDARGTITRPCGLRIDNGGSGKGLAADLVGRRMAPGLRWAVDCGGDIRVHGAGAPYAIEVRHPLTGETALVVPVEDGAVCTSGIDVRVWRRPDGRIAHHLLDPSTGEPAWTGLVGATAVAPSALEAETLAKTALLSGPEGARAVLARRGGILFHENGEVEPAGWLRHRAHAPIRAADLRRFAQPAGQSRAAA